MGREYRKYISKDRWRSNHQQDISVRQRLKTLTYPTVFLPLVTIKKLYLPSSVFQYNFEYTTIVILGLTGLQYLFVHVKFHDEDLAQRKVAIVITILKIVFTVGLLVATVCHSSLTSKARTISIVVYFDILLVTLVFLHYLWKDMKNFGKGLKKHILFRTRELKL
ncbi:uncharacterized protein VICG_01845 [Vittaforma corneae ATCC 50505]|uniref:Uncharacterized protein n=1 Tax=Vittaforma corneae (strain ATCC 50505) TaxID=993615 RepID=L2GJX8_VITCO|nr:uncharacterized protein VICG_01845 [Vittaforma corneae ATCC 50505]ELA41146.1 hypothetical protein VICG_01845 [Vittaforma corneae ATCC 50505]